MIKYLLMVKAILRLSVAKNQRYLSGGLVKTLRMCLTMVVVLVSMLTLAVVAGADGEASEKSQESAIILPAGAQAGPCTATFVPSLPAGAWNTFAFCNKEGGFPALSRGTILRPGKDGYAAYPHDNIVWNPLAPLVPMSIIGPGSYFAKRANPGAW